MFNWFKTFCVLFELVDYDHPWSVDWSARAIMQDRDRVEMLRHEHELIITRVKELEK